MKLLLVSKSCENVFKVSKARVKKATVYRHQKDGHCDTSNSLFKKYQLDKDILQIIKYIIL